MGTFRFRLTVAVLGAAGCGEAAAPRATALNFFNTPLDARAGVPLAPFSVTVVDARGNHAPGSVVSLSLDSAPPGAGLHGRLEARVIGGVATFDSVILDAAGSRLALRATMGDLTAVSGFIRLQAKLEVLDSPATVKLGALMSVRAGIISFDGHAIAVPWLQARLTLGNGLLRQPADSVSADSIRAGVATFANVRARRPGTTFLLIVSALPAGLAPDTATFAVTWEATSVSAGGSHTCGVSADGVAACWGDAGGGRLGVPGGFGDEAGPVVARANVPFVSVSAGLRHSCALASGGQAYCWGQDGPALGTGSSFPGMPPPPCLRR